jgi:hypothetical protein
MYLAIETGMHAQEILNLRWSDVDFENRTIRVRKHKNDRKRVEAGLKPGILVPMTVNVMSELIVLLHHLNHEDNFPGLEERHHMIRPSENPDSLIFIDRNGKPMAVGNMVKLFKKAIVKSGIEPHEGETLTFQCFRREATLWLQDCLEEWQVQMILGHMTKATIAHYRSNTAPREIAKITDKIDRHQLKACILDSAGNKVLDRLGRPMTEGLSLEEMVYDQNGRHISNLEMVKMGFVPITHLTSQSEVRLRIFTERYLKPIPEHWDKSKAFVYRYADDEGNMLVGIVPRVGRDHGKTLVRAEKVGHLTLAEIAKLTRCFCLSELDKTYKGVLSANGYLIISETRALEAMQRLGKEMTDAQLFNDVMQTSELYLSEELNRSDNSKNSGPKAA